MATEIKMPQMGESIAEGTLTRWFKKPGESVKRDEPLFEISTDKVDAEVPAPADGVLEKILVEEGTTVEVNSVVALFGDGSGASSGDAESEPEVSGDTSAPMTTAAASAPALDTGPGTATATATAPPPAAPASPPRSDHRKVRSSPLVRQIARENGIEDLSAIPGTGAGGRVTKGDILGFIERRGETSASPSAGATGAPATPASALPVLGLSRENADVQPLTMMRRKIAEHMVASRRTSAHVHSVFEVDMSAIVALRNRHKQGFQQRNGVKLTFTPFFMKAVMAAVREFPWVNASLDGDEIVVHRPINMGVAVALDGGLIVPVIRNADELSLVGLQKRVTDLATRARGKQLLPDEVAGGTFTITNPGQFGGLFGIPIINQPQVAILGIGGIQRRPVVVEGDAIAIRDMAHLCLGYDHRLVDGAYADQFMARVKENLESWDELP